MSDLPIADTGEHVARGRFLIITADDYGIGPATSQGILQLAAKRLVSGTVLLVNSPHATQAVKEWRQAGMPVELGWHPCLTLDAPILPAGNVPSLVDADGKFKGLGKFLRALWLRRISANEIRAELQAQYCRFQELVGWPPTVVNSHHHVQVFKPIGDILLDILGNRIPLPYLRRVQEPMRTLARVPGARIKRLFLSSLGRLSARRQDRLGLPGNLWLAGITDPPCVSDPAFLVRWIRNVPGRVVELTCHPGHLDSTLIGRDCKENDAQMHRRVCELRLLSAPSFRKACQRAGFTIVSPQDLSAIRNRRYADAA